MTDNLTTELLPCPFCGGEAETFNPFNVDGTWCVLCSECAAATGFEQTEVEAIAAWNTRAAHGTLTAEQVMAIAGKHQPDYCSDTHVCFDWQAIADELNAKLGSGTCEPSIEPWEQDTTKFDAYCGNCGWEIQDQFFRLPNYCPNCGARIKKVKR